MVRNWLELCPTESTKSKVSKPWAECLLYEVNSPLETFLNAGFGLVSCTADCETKIALSANKAITLALMLSLVKLMELESDGLGVSFLPQLGSAKKSSHAPTL